MQISRKEIFDGIALTAVKTDKFKFNRIFIDFIVPLTHEHAAENALFADVLTRGTEKYPGLLAVQKKLSSLYGADIDSYVGTSGEAHIITIYAKLIKDKYTLGGESITAALNELLAEVITKPQTENGVFLSEYVESEKEKLINDIAAQINDKDSFALHRAIELMCANEAWGVSEFGKAEDVEKITPASLFEHYKYLLSHAQIEVFTVGEFPEGAEEALVRELFADTARGEVPDYSTKIIKTVEKVKTIREHQELKQGKLVLGFRTGIGGYEEDYDVLRVLNCVFGSGTQSKLFLNVREKLSLCYHCSSRIYTKGVMMVTSGIEVKNYEKAKNEILFQLDEIRNGNISETEISSAKKRLRNAMLSVSDSPEALHSWYANNRIFGITDTPEEIIAKTEAVTKEQLVAAAQKIALDTEYFLCGTEGKV
ncbi:MAG: insulinase family protein [Clostridia bacterium]|nr:insulinase family protein [Clostridia bacterium]